MSKVVMYISYTLVEGTAVEEFLAVTEKVNAEFMAKQKGYISWELFVDGDSWADVLKWETKEDAMNANMASCQDALASTYVSYIEEEGMQMHLFTSVKKY